MSKKKNYLVIHGERFDLVPDSDKTTCSDCALYDKCFAMENDYLFLCEYLFDHPDFHFERCI